MSHFQHTNKNSYYNQSILYSSPYQQYQDYQKLSQYKNHYLFDNTDNEYRNEFYQQKIHNTRLNYTILNKPGFLIKQSSIYPEEHQELKIQKVLNYADNITKEKVSKYYNQQVQQQRELKYGKNPFLITKPKLLQSNLQYLSKSSRQLSSSRKDLGVSSFRIFNQKQIQKRNKASKKQINVNAGVLNQKDKIFNGNPDGDINDYLNSIQDMTHKRAKKPSQHFQIEQQDSDQGMFYSQVKGTNRKTAKFIKVLSIPTVLIYQKKQFQQII